MLAFVFIPAKRIFCSLLHSIFLQSFLNIENANSTHGPSIKFILIQIIIRIWPFTIYLNIMETSTQREFKLNFNANFIFYFFTFVYIYLNRELSKLNWHIAKVFERHILHIERILHNKLHILNIYMALMAILHSFIFVANSVFFLFLMEFSPGFTISVITFISYMQI